MKKFSYKKMVDSLTFRRLGSSANVYELTVHSIATHPELRDSFYLEVFRKDYPSYVAMAAMAFLSSCVYSECPSLEFYADGLFYTWHIDRYSHIVFRCYRVLQ